MEKLIVVFPMVKSGIRANGCSKLSVISVKSAVDRLNPPPLASGCAGASANVRRAGSAEREMAMTAIYHHRGKWARRILSS
jgi:hypothetical protein